MIKPLILLLILFTTATIVNPQPLYKIPFGKKFHLASSRMVESVSERMTEKQAIKLGEKIDQLLRQNFKKN